MKSIIFLSTFFLSVLICGAQNYDTTGVMKTIEKLGQALSKPDPRMLADLFTEDGDFTNVIDSTIHGRENIYKHHYKLWVITGRPATRTVHALAHYIRFIKQDIAYIEQRWDNIHTAGADGTKLPDRDGIWTSVLVKENGEWYIAVARNTFLHDGTPGHELKNTAQETSVTGNTAAVKEFAAPGEFHKMLARSVGTWIGEGTMQFSSDAPPVNAGTSILINTMTMDGLYQISEIRGNPTGPGKPWTGLRITGYDNERKVFIRAMIGDGGAAGGVGMEGPWDEDTKSITMLFKKLDSSTGELRDLKEVYTIIDENTEVLKIYGTDPKTKKEFVVLHITWRRKK